MQVVLLASVHNIRHRSYQNFVLLPPWPLVFVMRLATDLVVALFVVEHKRR